MRLLQLERHATLPSNAQLCRLLLLSREDFDKVSASVGEKFDAKHNERMINSVEFLSTIKKADRDHLMEQMEEKNIHRKPQFSTSAKRIPNSTSSNPEKSA